MADRRRAHLLSVGIYCLTLMHADAQPVTVDLASGRRLAGLVLSGASHSHRFSASANTFLTIAVDGAQRPASIQVKSPHGGVEAETVPNLDYYGVVTLSAVLPTAGEYRLEIAGTGELGTSSYYEISVLEIRPSQPSDQTRLAAERALAPFLAAVGSLQPTSEERALAAAGEYRATCGKSGDPVCPARADYLSGLTQSNLNHFTEAIPLLERAWSAAEQIGPLSMQVGILHTLGVVHLHKGNSLEAESAFRRATKLAQAHNLAYLEAESLMLLNAVARERGQVAAERQYCERALELALAHGFDLAAAQARVQLALAYDGSDPSGTAAQAKAAVTTFRIYGDRPKEAIALRILAQVSYSISDYQEALQNADAAVRLQREMRDVDGEATALMLLGAVYRQLGDTAKAIAQFERSFQIARAGDKQVEIRRLLTLADLKREAGELTAARPIYEMVIDMARRIRLPRYEAQAELGLGRLRAASDPEAARSHFGRATQLYKSMDDYLSEGQAISLSARLSTGRERIALLKQALEQQAKVRDDFGQANTELAIGEELHRQGLSVEAMPWLQSALNRVESRRASIRAPGLRVTYFGRLRAFYDTCIDVLMEIHRREPNGGYDREALYVSERARARVLLDAAVQVGAADPVDLPAELATRERSLRARIRQTAAESSLPTGINRSVALDGLLADYELLYGEILTQKSDLRELVAAPVLKAHEITEKLLDKDTTLLEYRLGRTRSYVWILTRGKTFVRELASEAELVGLVKALTKAQTAPDTINSDQQYWRAAGALSKAILSPVADYLQSKRILIVADGALQRVSFAGLPLPGKGGQPVPLVAVGEVHQIASASVMAASREYAKRPKADRGVLVFADPVFGVGDSRLLSPQASADESLPRLRGSRSEAEVVRAAGGKGTVRLLTDFDANLAAAIAPEVSRYRIVQFSTHTLIDEERPELSGVVLSQVDRNGRAQEGVLRMLDIHRLRLGADLVVLSACSSASGKEVPGEGLMALSRAFLYAGSPSVLAALWPIKGRFPEHIMRKFYGDLLSSSGESKPGQALRAAQLEMHRMGFSPRKWAAFVLLGG